MAVRGKQIRQMCEVLDALSAPNGATYGDLMERLGLQRRQVERIIENMEAMAFPIYGERPEGEREKRWKLEASYVIKLPNTTIPNLTLSYHEMLCLYFLDRDDPVFKGTFIEKKLKSVFAKLSHFFPDEFSEALERMRKLRTGKAISRKCYTDHQQTITDLTEAMIQQEAIEITYHKYHNDTQGSQTIHPLHFFEEDGGLYIIAVKEKTGDIRTYAVERMRRIRKAGHTFDPPKAFQADTYLSRTFGIVDDGEITVTVRISERQARYANERTWAPGQILKSNPDGSVDVSFTTRGIRDVKKWVLGWGAEAEVVSPGWFRVEVKGEIEKMLKKYG